MYKSCSERKLIFFHPNSFKSVTEIDEMHFRIEDWISKAVQCLTVPFRHLIKGADAYLETSALRSFSCTMHCSGLGTIQAAGHLALLKTFPLDLGAMVKNFTVEKAAST